MKQIFLLIIFSSVFVVSNCQSIDSLESIIKDLKQRKTTLENELNQLDTVILSTYKELQKAYERSGEGFIGVLYDESEIYDKPSVISRNVIGRLPKGTPLIIINRFSSYYQIKYLDQDAYIPVFKAYLDRRSDEDKLEILTRDKTVPTYG